MRKFRKIPLVLMIGSVVLLSACSVAPEKMTEDDHLQRVAEDTQALFAEQEQVTAPITLYDAMARALKYNMDHRLSLMQGALSRDNLTAANLSLLPQLTLQAGYTNRDNDLGSNSRSLSTGLESLESSTSSDRELRDASLGLTWNVLDFGLSYIRAQQRADLVLIEEERRRKVVHNLIQDVRVAYWNAVSAERVLKKTEPLMDKVKQALKDASSAQGSGRQSPLVALNYRRDLLESLRQLKSLNRELNASKTKLAALMNLKPGTAFELDAGEIPMNVPTLQLQDVEALEKVALLQRPELREEGYSSRISHNDIRSEYLRILPGINLSTAFNYDSNSFAAEDTWVSGGVSISKNLFEVFNAPKNIKRAKSQLGVNDFRRYAFSMAIMSQVHISLASYAQAVDEYKTVAELFDVESEIKDSVQANMKAGSTSQRDLISAELQSVLSEVRRDLAYSQMRNAVGRIYISIGEDPLPETLANDDLATVAEALKEVNEKWFSNGIKVVTLPSPSSAQSDS